jgi:mono/diheme cytochrome c family protein
MGVWIWTALAVVVALATPVAAQAADGDLARGNYLLNSIVACGNCHTPKGPDGKAIDGQDLSGGTVIEIPAFRAVAPNITQDRETGIGGWTDQQIIAAIREGRRPDGTIIGPPMPIEFYRSMSDNDVRAIVAALRRVPAISHKVEKSTYKIPLPPSYGPPVTHVPDVGRGNPTAYGRYLADIGHCMECHTPFEKGRLDTVRWGGGGRELPSFPAGVVISANLTPGNPNGVAHWTNAQFKNTIKTGIRPDGRALVRTMAFDWYKNVKDDDLNALVAYLRTLKPVKN